MKKSDDLIRELLLRYEADDEWLHIIPGNVMGADSQEQRECYHVFLMMDEGLLTEVGNGTMRLTSYGHAFIEAIRDDTVWNKTKAGVAKIGGASIRLTFDIATALVKQKVSELVGLSL